MNEQITAIVENGILRPTKPLELPDGTRVELTLSRAVPELRGPKPTAEIKAKVAAIVAMPIEDGPEFTGRDHDRVLYGEENKR